MCISKPKAPADPNAGLRRELLEKQKRETEESEAKLREEEERVAARAARDTNRRKKAKTDQRLFGSRAGMVLLDDAVTTKGPI